MSPVLPFVFGMQRSVLDVFHPLSQYPDAH